VVSFSNCEPKLIIWLRWPKDIDWQP
jgi:hypothetical protein